VTSTRTDVVIRTYGPGQVLPLLISTREITRRTLVTAGVISQPVARAERDGFVRRAPGSAGDRTVLVSLTPAGHALIERSVDAVLGREATREPPRYGPGVSGRGRRRPGRRPARV
jgi:hypothetical protein